jgi:hypothetical protein
MQDRKREQQERMVKDICRKLGCYTHADVEDAMRKWSRNRNQYSRVIPTSRQLIKLLQGARWHVVAVPGTKHRPTLFEYRENGRSRR